MVAQTCPACPACPERSRREHSRRERTIGQNIGLAYLLLELAEIGTQVKIEVFGELIKAEVASDVLYDRRGTRLRS